MYWDGTFPFVLFLILLHDSRKVLPFQSFIIDGSHELLADPNRYSPSTPKVLEIGLNL
jgi:hypothetical protein